MPSRPGSGSGGGNRLSPEEHRLRGTYKPSLHGSFETPKAPRGLPEPPGKLTGPARKEWDRICACLEKLQTLSTVDASAIYQHCLLVGDTEQLRKDREKNLELVNQLRRVVVERLQGEQLTEAMFQLVKLQSLIGRQAVQLRQQALAIRQYLMEFGLTPASRSRVKVQPERDSMQTKLLSFSGGRAATGLNGPDEPTSA